MTTKAQPRRRAPHCADHVGSLLRPKMVRDLRDLARPQKGAGLKIVTDGDVRRQFRQYHFRNMLTRLDPKPSTRSLPFQTEYKTPLIEAHLTGPRDFPANHPTLRHFTFVQHLVRLTHGIAKTSIQGPLVCRCRMVAENIEYALYLDPANPFHDIAATDTNAVQTFYNVGCRYLQRYDIFFADLGEGKQRKKRRAMRQEPDKPVRKYACILEESIKDQPGNQVIGMLICRGNLCSLHVAAGGDDLAACAIFRQPSVDVYFMEYETERSAGLESLKLPPNGDKQVMAGFITTKTVDLENLDRPKTRFDEALKYLDRDQPAIALQYDAPRWNAAMRPLNRIRRPSMNLC